MLESCQNAQERWGGVHKLIDRWLVERGELVMAFQELRKAQHAFADKAKHQHFCEILVDYVSAWHFEVYEQLINEAKAFDDKKALKVAEDTYPLIDAITESALAFNDECADGKCKDTERFATELSKLGALLQERFLQEDRLIDELHNAHKEEATEQA
ncbi:sigma D regulator [Pseudomonas sp. R5(2019)]|uniref:sigma D regulator n=1 Tax=Pseudomonas sp. R5(2019) TaxID=2697566 RepID=UPI001412DE8A|nr:sigma D regulator [Pseudomonas sp. R5(2019)]NBA94350.1 sigma D regulator [Pseudomonas sp. R5(2019)]